MRKSNLLIELYSNLNTTGALTFSSKSLVKKMVTQVDLSNADLIVELGGGDGSITQGILDQMGETSRLLVFEINSSFCEEMRRQFDSPRVEIINKSADQLVKHLDGQKVDYIFSSLPFSLISQEVSESIMSQSKDILHPNGAFIQVSYSFLVKRYFKKFFSQIKVGFTLKNIPPAFVMVCRN